MASCSGTTPAPPASTAAAPPAQGQAAQPTGANQPATSATKARTQPSNSSTIAITSDDGLVVVTNPLNGSVTVLNVKGDKNEKAAEIKVGIEPQMVAISPDDKFAYVTNQGSNSMSVIDLTTLKEVEQIKVGTEPYGVVFSPDGRNAYIVNGGSRTMTILDIVEGKAKVSGTTNLPVIEPRGIAITANNNGVGSQFLYVTQFLSQRTANGAEMSDKGKEGKVLVISTSDNKTIAGTITLSAKDAGFAADRSAFGGGKTDPTFAYPNQLQWLVLKNGRGYLPNIGASPEAPNKFDINTQALVSVFDVASKAELSGGTINIHEAVKAQTATPKLFFANPWALDFKHKSNEGYVVSAGSNVIAKLKLADDGKPTVVSAPDGDKTRVLEVPVGKNPRGIVVNNADTRAYVMNFISRDVSIIDLSASPEKEMARVAVAALPAKGTDNFVTLVGNELFNTSVGEFDEGVKGRMSNNGWQACSSCHFEGLTDGVVWQFPAGPRKSIPLNATFNPKAPDTDQRVLNYSGIFDEVCDFEINIRNVSGGQGLIITDTAGSFAPHPTLTSFNPPNCGRKTLTVQGVPAWEAITQWVAKKVRSPQAPNAGVDPASEIGQQVALGRAKFIEANCQLCHGGSKWSGSQVDFARTSPPSEPVALEPAPVAQVGHLKRFLRDVGTFNPSLPIEKNLANLGALGKPGFNPPSLLSIYAFGPYLHNGACADLACVLENAVHRDAGGKVGVLDDPKNRAAVVEFLRAIDTSTEVINAP